MKHPLFYSLILATVVTGCGGGAEDELPTAANNSSGVSVTDPLGAGGKQAESNTPDPMSLIPRPPETLIDVSSVERPLDNSGKVMDDLAYLNHLVFNLNEGRATYVSDVIPQFRNDAERLAYEAALAKSKEPVKDLEELVRLKVVKALPQAPAGKRYAINATSGKVELVNQ
jgi:hypothetical protein